MAIDEFWIPLLGAPPGQGTPARWRMLRKAGRPFLLLPLAVGPALVALNLYPAQTARARLARAAVGWLLRTRIPVGTHRVSLAVSAADVFVAFLAAQAGLGANGIPRCGILAGNPAHASRRFVLLLFDSIGRPRAVVKAGLTPEARALVRREAAFLGRFGGKVPGLPALQAIFQGDRAEALALEFLKGESPPPTRLKSLPNLLWPWVDTKRRLVLGEAPDWRRLAQAAAHTPGWPEIATAVAGHGVHPALAHGDLTPWNLRISPQGVWTAIDWERGEPDGIPGWDWFHYVVQVGILVERLPTPALADRAKALLAAPAFRLYAEHAGIAGIERELFLAYLIYSIEVLKPAAGLAETRELLAALSEQ